MQEQELLSGDVAEQYTIMAVKPQPDATCAHCHHTNTRHNTIDTFVVTGKVWEEQDAWDTALREGGWTLWRAYPARLPIAAIGGAAHLVDSGCVRM